MVLRAAQDFPITIRGVPVPRLDPNARLGLRWPRWFPSTADDREKDARTLSTLAAAGQISRQTAVHAVADTYDIEDTGEELKRIARDLRIEQRAGDDGRSGTAGE